MEDGQGRQGGLRHALFAEVFTEGVDLEGQGDGGVGVPQKIWAVGSVKMIRRFFSGHRMWPQALEHVDARGSAVRQDGEDVVTVMDRSESLSWAARARRAGSAFVTIR